MNNNDDDNNKDDDGTFTAFIKPFKKGDEGDHKWSGQHWREFQRKFVTLRQDADNKNYYDIILDDKDSAFLRNGSFIRLNKTILQKLLYISEATE